MEPYEYDTLFECETSYWWYRGLRGILIETLERLRLGPSPRILDAGCGTGATLQAIRRRVTPLGFGFDLSAHAARYWPRRDLRQMCRGSVNAIPFRDAVFDAALCIDVLESDGVVEERAYRELWRVVRPGGFVLIVVPAYAWLFNESHHKAVHARRRYTRGRLLGLLKTAPARVLRVSYLFPTLLPALTAYRVLQRLPMFAADSPRSDLRPLPSVLNELLFRVVDVERVLLSRIDFPFGSSILSVVQKPGPDEP